MEAVIGLTSMIIAKNDVEVKQKVEKNKVRNDGFLQKQLYDYAKFSHIVKSGHK